MWSPPDTRVFVFDATTWALATYATSGEAIAQTPGMDVAEGDTLFFAADGSPLLPHFSEPARFTSDTTYVNGVYSLSPGAGRTLQYILFR